jgi:hypothetical protein
MAASISLSSISMPDFERLLAAWARLIFCAVKAEDLKATEEARFQFLHILVCFLPRHLSQDARWGENNSFLDCFGGAPLAFVSPTWLRVCDEVWIMLNDPYLGSGKSGYSCRTREPFEFEMELCSQTGNLLGYSMHFGDRKQLAGNLAGETEQGTWAFSFQQGVVPRSPPSDRVHFLHDASDWKTADDSKEGTTNRFCERIEAYARQISRSNAANDPDAIEQSIRGLQHNLDALVGFRKRAYGSRG